MQTSVTKTQEPSRRSRGAMTWLATWLFWAFATGLMFVISLDVLQVNPAASRCDSWPELALFWDDAFVHLLLISAVIYLPLRAVLPRLGMFDSRAHLAAGAVGGAILGLLMAAPLARLAGLVESYKFLRTTGYITICEPLVIDWQSLFVLNFPRHRIEPTVWAVTVAATAVIVALLCGVVAAGLVERLFARPAGVALEDSPLSPSWRWSKLFLALPVGVALADLVLQLAGTGSGKYLALIHGPLGLAVVALEKLGWGLIFAAAAVGVGSLVVSSLTWRLLTPLPACWTWGHAIAGAVAMCLMVRSVTRLAGEVVPALAETWGRPAWNDPRAWLICGLAGLLWGGLSAAILRRRLSSAHSSAPVTQG